MAAIEKKSFDSPDEARPHEGKGKAEIVEIGGQSVARITLEPGWKWSVNLKPIVSLVEQGLILDVHGHVSSPEATSNYLMLMMVDPYVHFHVLPRYREPQEFRAVTFADKGWPGTPDLASGITLAGIGSAFWGLVAGLALFGARHVLGGVSVSAAPK